MKKGKSHLYVNVYDNGRCYGGPEEGGWYYDCGDVVDSFRVKRREVKRIVKREEAQCKPSKKWRSTPRCFVRVEKHSGQPYPSRRPYYE